MPELPEVETYRKLICPFINKTIQDIYTCSKTIFFKPIRSLDPKNLIYKEKIVGCKIVDILRKGKYLVIELNHSLSILIHLAMAGKITTEKTLSEPNKKHLVARIKLNSNSFINYVDTRFGHFLLYNKKDVESVLNRLGPDILSNEFTVNYLFTNSSKSNKKIKELLMDQELQCGIGNIYGDEILFESSILPYKISKKLSFDNIKTIVSNAKKILKLSIKYKGTSFDSAYSIGNFQKHLNVYGQKVCKKCGTKIKKITISGRTSYFCPHCQH